MLPLHLLDCVLFEFDCLQVYVCVCVQYSPIVEQGNTIMEQISVGFSLYLATQPVIDELQAVTSACSDIILPCLSRGKYMVLSYKLECNVARPPITTSH